LRILFAASEVTPFAKTGGLADVVGSLPRALSRRGHDCVVMLPFYESIRSGPVAVEPADRAFEIPIGSRRVTGRLWRSRLPESEVKVILVEQADYFGRANPATGYGIYQHRLPSGQMRDYADNCQRFVFLCRAVLEAAPLLNWWPDIIHANDWQTGLIPVYLKELERYAGRDEYAAISTLFTIHNLAYQGTFWHWDMGQTGLDWRLFNWRQLEFYGHLNLLKGGIVFADAISTVSPRYAQEIQTPGFGCRLEGVLQQNEEKLVGILNGIDYDEWNSATDPHLPARYDRETVTAGKAACKVALQRSFGLPEESRVPLLGIIARLEDQKLRVLREPGVAEKLVQGEVQLVVLGTGRAEYHRLLTDLKTKHPEKVGLALEFNEKLAHQIEAGADIFLMPSQFEPSGLNQLYSLRYGTVPLVHDTGGLHDTVTDCTPATLEARTATGFVFRPYLPPAFLEAVARALAIYRNHPAQWLQLVRTGMGQDWSWARSAKAYEDVYLQLKSGQWGVGSGL
jgi:starch synthase